MSKDYKKCLEPKEFIEDTTKISEETLEDISEDDKEVEVFTTTSGIVVCDLLNVRKEPSKDSDILRVLKRNENVEIIETIDDWYKILPEGYLMKEFVK